MIERGEDFKFLQQPESEESSIKIGGERERNRLDSFLVFAQSPEHLQIAVRQSFGDPPLRQHWVRRGNPIELEKVSFERGRSEVQPSPGRAEQSSS